MNNNVLAPSAPPPLPSFKKRRPVPAAQTLLVRESVPFSNTLPLVIEPACGDVDVTEWARANQMQVEEKFAHHGAILFRGFAIDPVADLERLARVFSPDLADDNGEHVPIAAGSSISTPVAYAREKKLLWHNENSFNASWPAHIWFACAKPADTGGETPLVDSRKVFDAIHPDVRQAFIDRQIMYVRNYGTGLGLHWADVFRTRDPREVEAKCREARMEYCWKAGGVLETRAIRPAVIRTPSGAMSWFNQAQHWHVACLDPETRSSLTSLLAERDLPRNCRYGNGDRIDDGVMEHILDVYRALEVVFPWRRHDVLMVDNMSVAHARNPYTGERRQLVAVGKMTSFDGIV